MIISRQNKNLSSSKRRRGRLIAGLLLLFGLGGILISFWMYFSRPYPLKQTRGVGIAPAPSSMRLSAKTIAAYTVPPDLPKYLNIPAVGVGQTRIVKLGHLTNGEIATPDNIFDVGWYEDSTKPGQPGAMFMYGHVSSWHANGIFHDLKKLRAGDKVTITRGDNRKFTYQVVSSKIYDYQHVDMHQVLSSIEAGKPGLNLMTCTGHIIKGTSEFSQRLVVFTNLVSS